MGDHLRQAQAAGLRWPLPQGLDEATLERLLCPPPRPSREARPLPPWGEIHQELKRKGVTLALPWAEYKAAHPGGLQYSVEQDLPAQGDLQDQEHCPTSPYSTLRRFSLLYGTLRGKGLDCKELVSTDNAATDNAPDGNWKPVFLHIVVNNKSATRNHHLVWRLGRNSMGKRLGNHTLPTNSPHCI